MPSRILAPAMSLPPYGPCGLMPDKFDRPEKLLLVPKMDGFRVYQDLGPGANEYSRRLKNTSRPGRHRIIAVS